MDRKTALESRKRQLLHEMQYCESRIAEARRSCSVQPMSDDGSDSDSDMPFVIDTGPSFLQLKKQQKELHNCFNATQELCDIVIIESEVNVLVEPPQFTNEPPVTEPGSWREVTAECTVDHLVPFVISFFVHQPERRFAPMSFRGLQVQPIKSKHALELIKCVLPELARPSDAVEVIRSYAAASRSRRDTLARLHEKFGADIVMDAKPEGGFLIGCANLLEISWTLQNKFSPIAPFHHRMKFDVENMEEEYIRSITQAYCQLSEPDVDTDDRTTLLAAIINTCLRARGETQEQHESMSSDPEGPGNRTRTTLDREPEAPGTHRKSKQSTIMAPPKSLPKKTKPKQKDNTNANSKAGNAVKRTNQDGGDQISGKRLKVSDKESEKEMVENGQGIAKIIENIEKKQESNKTDEVVTKTVSRKKKTATENIESENTGNRGEKKKKSVASVKNKDQKEADEKSGEPSEPNKKLSAKTKDVVPNNDRTENKELSNDTTKKKVTNVDKKKTNEKLAKLSVTNVENAGRSENNAINNVDMEKKPMKTKSANSISTKKVDDITKKVLQGKDVKKVLNASKGKPGKVVKKVVSKPTQVQKPVTSADSVKKVDGSSEKVAPPTKKVNVPAKKGVAPDKKVVTTAKNVVVSAQKVATSDKNINPSKKVVNSTFNTEKSSIATLRDKLPNVSPIPKIVASEQNKNPNMKKNPTNILPIKKSIPDTNKAKSSIVKPKHTVVSKNIPLNPSNKPKFGTKFSGGKITKSGNIDKENKAVTKIPLKQLKSVPETIIRKNTLRISPRKGLSKPGATKPFVGAKTAKPVSTTNIPRLVKPKPRVT